KSPVVFLSLLSIQMRSTVSCGINTAILPLPLSEVIQHAKDFPNYNVAISSHRGVGKLFFWDVDSAGVVEQVEAETGQIIPATFTVQSRPELAPYKQHQYLRSTPYSFERFGGWKSKEVNVKDL